MRALATLLLMLILSACARASVASPPPAPGLGPVRLWQDAAIFTAVKSLIGGADTRVWVEMYEFERDDLAAALASARHRGADVRLLVDPTVAGSRQVASALGRAGVAARLYPVDDSRHQIDHVKLLLADGRALVGGMNWGRGSAANHDYALELAEDQPVARLGAVFEQDWSLAGGRPGAPAPPGPAGGGGARAVQTSPGEEIRALLGTRLAGARTAVAAELFELTDSPVIALLAEAARRGARVRVILDPGQDANLGPSRLLAAAGVAVRRYPVEPPAKLHAKAAVIDGRLLLGSANWTHGGLSVNHELDVETASAQAVAAFAARFERDWAWSKQ